MTSIAASRPQSVTSTAARVLALTPTKADLQDAGFLIGLVMVALLALRTTFDGPLFLAAGLLGLLLGIGAAHVSNVLRHPVFILVLLVVAVYFLVGGAIGLRESTVAGVVPTASSVTGLSHLAVGGWKDLLTTLPPIDGAGQLVVLPYLLGLICGAMGFTVARRTRATWTALLVPGAALAVSILLGTRAPATPLLVGIGTAALACGWLVVRHGRRSLVTMSGISRGGRVARAATGGALLVLAAVTAGLLGPGLPAGGQSRLVLRNYVEPPFDPSTYPSPLAGFRKYTQGAALLWDQKLLTVTGLPEGARLRFATLDAYSGTAWGAGALAIDPSRPDTYQRVGTTIDQPGLTDPISYTVQVEPAYAAVSDLNVWLPNAGPAGRVEFGAQTAKDHDAAFRYNLSASQGIVPDRLRAGEKVTITGAVSPVAGERDLPTAGGVMADPSSFAFLAPQSAKWGGGQGAAWGQLVKVGAHLRTSGAYSDGTSAGETQYLPGHGVGRLLKFVNAKQAVGNDEQYAATFALIANQLGVPARVVLGAVVPADGGVRGQDVHAWVEVLAADGAWVTVPETLFMPNRNKRPDQQEPDPVQDLNAQMVPPPAASHPPGSSETLANADAGAQGRRDGEQEGSGFQLPEWAVRLLRIATVPVGAVLAFWSIVVLAKMIRRRRRRTQGSATMRLAGGWREILDRATDFGTIVPEGRTRREQGRLLAPLGVAGLADAADASVFGPGEPDDAVVADYWAHVAQARKEMGARHTVWRRLRAVVSLRSLVPAVARVSKA